MERTREMHIAERERRMAVLNGLMEENDLAVMVCHGNGAMTGIHSLPRDRDF